MAVSSQRTLALQEAGESVKRDIGHVMLDTLSIKFRALLGDTDGAQQIDDEPMAGTHTIGKAMPFRRQENATVKL